MSKKCKVRLCKTRVPTNYPALWAAPFGVTATPSNIIGKLTYDWDFGDGSPHSTNQYAARAYASAGTYIWKVVSTITAPTGNASTTNSGSITVFAPTLFSAGAAGGNLTLTWPQSMGAVMLQQTPTLNPPSWTTVTNVMVPAGGQISVTVPVAVGTRFYRLRQF